MWTTAKIPRDWQRTSLVRTVMHVRTESALETRLAEALMSALYPCDLGDGIEVLHDVEEQIEIEMDCDLGDDAWDSAPYEKIEIHFEPSAAAPAFEDLSSRSALHLLNLNAFERSAVWDTLPFAPFEPSEVQLATGSGRVPRVSDSETVPYPRCDEGETVPFVRYYFRR